MKKALSLLLCAVMLLGMLPMSVFAASGNTFIITADKTEVLPGDEVVFNIPAESTEACDTFGMVLEFDRDVFEFVKGSVSASYLNEDEEELVAVKTFRKDAGAEGVFAT